MRLLLDTHTFLWLAEAPDKLSPTVRGLILDPDTVLILSVISLWEILIKSALGKLSLRLPLRRLLTEQQNTNGLHILPVTLDHVLALDGLPLHHKDPFDRLLIAQATVEGLTLASVDHVFSHYPVALVW